MSSSLKAGEAITHSQPCLYEAPTTLQYAESAPLTSSCTAENPTSALHSAMTMPPGCDRTLVAGTPRAPAPPEYAQCPRALGGLSEAEPAYSSATESSLAHALVEPPRGHKRSRSPSVGSRACEKEALLIGGAGDRLSQTLPLVAKAAHRRKPRAKIYPCPSCDKWFDRPSALATHSHAHTGEQRARGHYFWRLLAALTASRSFCLSGRFLRPAFHRAVERAQTCPHAREAQTRGHDRVRRPCCWKHLTIRSGATGRDRVGRGAVNPASPPWDHRWRRFG